MQVVLTRLTRSGSFAFGRAVLDFFLFPFFRAQRGKTETNNGEVPCCRRQNQSATRAIA
jgi:hypothetical protein